MPVEPTERQRPRHPWIGPAVNFSLALLAFALLALVLWQNREKIHEVFSRPLDLRLLGLGILIFQCSLLITYVRWYLLVKVIEPRFTLRATMLLGFIGYVFNLVIPGAVGGDFIKAAYLVRMHIRKTQAVASMLIDRILGLLGLFLIATVAGIVAWQMAETNSDLRKLICAAWVATALGFAGLALIFSQILTRLFPGLACPGRGRFALILTELRTMSTTYRRRLDLVAGALGLSALGHMLNVLAFYLMSRMLFPFESEMPTTLAQHFLMVPLTLFTMVVPLPFGALGVSEKIGDELFKLVGHPSGALAMMAFRVLMYACGLVSAFVYLARMQEVRSLTASAHQLEEDILEGELDLDEQEPEIAAS